MHRYLKTNRKIIFGVATPNRQYFLSWHKKYSKKSRLMMFFLQSTAPVFAPQSKPFRYASFLDYLLNQTLKQSPWLLRKIIIGRIESFWHGSKIKFPKAIGTWTTSQQITYQLLTHQPMQTLRSVLTRTGCIWLTFQLINLPTNQPINQ